MPTTILPSDSRFAFLDICYRYPLEAFIYLLTAGGCWQECVAALGHRWWRTTAVRDGAAARLGNTQHKIKTLSQTLNFSCNSCSYISQAAKSRCISGLLTESAEIEGLTGFQHLFSQVCPAPWPGPPVRQMLEIPKLGIGQNH